MPFTQQDMQANFSVNVSHFTKYLISNIAKCSWKRGRDALSPDHSHTTVLRLVSESAVDALDLLPAVEDAAQRGGKGGSVNDVQDEKCYSSHVKTEK